jgi:hypothetical protein
VSTYGAGMAHQTLDIARSTPRRQAGATIGVSIPLIDSRFFVDLQPAEQARDDCTGAETAAPISGLDLDCGSRRGADQASRRPKPQGRAWCRIGGKSADAMLAGARSAARNKCRDRTPQWTRSPRCLSARSGQDLTVLGRTSQRRSSLALPRSSRGTKLPLPRLVRSSDLDMTCRRFDPLRRIRQSAGVKLLRDVRIAAFHRQA